MSEQAPDQSDQAGVRKTAPVVETGRGGGLWTVGRLLKKYLAAVIAVVVVALTATFNVGLQNLFDGLLPDGWDEPGSGIKVVDVRRLPESGQVLIPPSESATFTSHDDAQTKVNDPGWEAEREWYAVERGTWEVTLVGRHNDPVVITDLRPERTGACTKKLRRGVLVDDVSQGEGQKIEMTTAIDASVPKLTSLDDGTAYFDSGTVTLAKGETVIISIQATSAGPTCQWVLEADYVDHGKRESMTITAPGDRPFGITGASQDHPYDLTWTIGCDRAVKPEDWASTDYCK